MESTDQTMASVPSDVRPTRNYTSAYESCTMWYISKVSKDRICNQAFRTRRSYNGFHQKGQERERWTQALGINLGNNKDIGAFAKLTNSYFLVGGEDEADNFCRTVQGDLPKIPVVRTSLGGCRIIGRMCVGNKHGILVPEATYGTELEDLKEQLPDSVQIKHLDERLSALGNVIACNDRIALIHPELDKDSEEMIENTLQVEVFRHLIANNPLVGSCCVLNNSGGLVHVDINKTELEDLSSLLELSLVPGTVNYGKKVIAAGLVANDTIAYAGITTTAREFSAIENAFKFKIYMKRW